MKIRNLIILTSALLFSVCVLAQETKTISSKLNQATVFFNGAELTHSASTQLIKGTNEVIIDGLSPSIEANSLKIKTTNSVIVSSHEFTVSYLSSTISSAPALKKIVDSIAFYKAALDKANVDFKINNDLLTHLHNGVSKNVSGSEKGLEIAELMKTMDYFKGKSEEFETMKIALTNKISTLNLAIQRLQLQYNQESTKNNKAVGTLKLKLAAPNAVNTTFTVAYFTPNANWAPYYDINITSIDKPILFALKSNVRQTTGLDWDKVKLTLSTATPSNGKIAPLFSAWFLEQQQIQMRAKSQMTQNSYSYDEMVLEEIAAPANKTIIRGSSTSEPQRPMVIIDGRVASPEELSSIDPNSIKNTEVLKDAAATSIYGAGASNGVIVVTLKKSVEDFISATDDAMNMAFNIDMLYSIPGNGKVQSIDLQTKEAPAEFKYYCAPKLDIETYLLAEIPAWDKLGLLSGKANITYDGTYVGETFIDAVSTHEKLALTLGSDKRVSVKREKMQDFSSTKFLGSDVLQVFTYKLTVKNNQNKAIKMVLKDQYPISTQKNIEVLLRKETTPWTTNKEEVGVITWEEDFKAGETKVYQISYSVKYPKDMRLNL